MEQFANNANTLVAVGGYTAGSGVLNVSSTAAPFPQVGNFSVVIFDAATKLPKVVLTVTAVNSITQFAVTAEGTDANAAAGDLVHGPAITARVMKNIGWVLLDSKTANNSASLDFTSVITSLYDEYRFELISLVPATNGAKPGFEVSTDNGSNYDTGANYAHVVDQTVHTGSYGSGYNSGRNCYDLWTAQRNSAGDSMCGSARLYNPLSTSLHKHLLAETSNYYTDGRLFRTDFAGIYLSTTAVNAIRFKYDTGNITSGTVRIYGVPK